MSAPLHPDLTKDLDLVGTLVLASAEPSLTEQIQGLVAQLLPILNGMESRVVAMALWSILMAMAEGARDRGKELIAADSAAKGPVN